MQAGERVVLMVNNLGASTPLEMACVAREAVSYLQEHAKVCCDAEYDPVEPLSSHVLPACAIFVKTMVRAAKHAKHACRQTRMPC